MNKPYSTYILASKRKGALFVGVTDDLETCILDHKGNLVPGPTSLYAIHMLVYHNRHPAAGAALLEEMSIKSLSRAGKLELVERHNANWRDLYFDLVPGDQVG